MGKARPRNKEDAMRVLRKGERDRGAEWKAEGRERRGADQEIRRFLQASR